MRKFGYRFLMLAGSFLYASLASGADLACQGVVFPDSAVVDGHSLVLNGAGVRLATFLKIKVYVAALYLPSRVHEGVQAIRADGPAELKLVFVRDVGVTDIRKAWREGFEKNAGAHVGVFQERLDKLNAWMTDVTKGDRMMFVRRPTVGLELSVNDQRRGVIPGDDFAETFFSIWLGASPPNGELKAGLLGAPCDS